MIEHFRQFPDLAERYGERETPNGTSLYLARPIQIKSGACLECHSTVDAAPKTMIDLYGPAKVVADGVFPIDVLSASTNYRAACEGVQPPQGVWAHICGSDLIRVKVYRANGDR